MARKYMLTFARALSCSRSRAILSAYRCTQYLCALSLANSSRARLRALCFLSGTIWLTASWSLCWQELFGDAPFREAHSLAAVNSINWARILAQTVYYVYAYLQA
eukprot:1121408-Pleurochrysis_carterae.AAC.1